MRESRDAVPYIWHAINKWVSPSEKRLQSRSIDRRTGKSCLRKVMRKRAPELLKSFFNFRASREKKMRYKRTNFSMRCICKSVLCGNSTIYGNTVVGRRLFTATRSTRRIFLRLTNYRRAIFFDYTRGSLRFSIRKPHSRWSCRMFSVPLLFASFS